MIYHDGYGDFHGLEKSVKKATKTLKDHLGEFDSIIVTGISGMAVGFPAALRMKLPVIVFRKKSENAHTDRDVGTKDIGKRAVFLDDFINNGTTKSYVTKRAHSLYGATIIASYLYRDDEWRPS